VRVSSLSGEKSVLGVNVNVDPLERQVPGGAGSRMGNGEFFATGAENLTVTGTSGATPVAPFAGVTEATLRAGTGMLVVDVDTRGGGPPPLVLAGVARLRARLTSAPVTPPAKKTRTTVVTATSGERRPRAL
jgi:hypothetical protein